MPNFKTTILSRCFATLVAVPLLFSLAVRDADAAPVTFNLLDPSGTGGTAGEGFESSSTFTAMGVTVSEIALGTDDNAAPYSANTNDGGVNSAGSADGASVLDAGELFQLTFDFDDTALMVSLTEFDFSGVGGSAGGDAVFVSVNGGTPFTLQTGAANFNGSTDAWSPSLVISDGDVLTITAEDVIAFQSFTLDISALAVPEPGSAFALAISCGFIVVRRRRSS